MVHYKLIYFNHRGSAELPRQLFKLKGVEFDDERVDKEKWETMKKDMPMAALPVLEVDGVKYSQSAAIARYLAKQFGLVGSTPLHGLLIDELHEVTAEIFQREITKIFTEKDDAEKAKLAKTFVEGSFQKYLDFFEMRLKENNDGTGFFIGDEITLGDLVVYNGLCFADEFMKKLSVDTKLSSRQLLVSWMQKVETTPPIAKWLKERPVTEW